MKKANKKWIILAIVAVVLWTMFIWGNSIVPGPKSNQMSNHVIAKVSPFMGWLKLTAKQWDYFVRKAAHMTEFGILSVFWCALLSQCMSHTWKLPFISLGTCFLTACIDETIQIFTGRTSRFKDVCFDTAGAFIGICLFIGIGYCLLYYRRKSIDTSSIS